MKWLHVLGHLRRGGVEQRLVWTIRSLGPRYQHLIVSLDGSQDVLEAAPDVMARCRILDAPRGVSALSIPRWIRSVVREERPEALLSYEWGGFDAVLAKVLFRLRTPAFHFEDGFTAEEIAKMPRRRRLARRVCLPRIDATIVPSSTLAVRAKERWKVPENRLVHVPNGVPRSEGQDRVEVRERLGLAPGTIVAAAVGRLFRVKRMDRAIDAAMNTGVHLVIIGDGPERERLERHAREVGAPVTFAGSSDSVRGWLRGCDLYVSTSESEQHPLAMLEAMDEGLPVIATDVGDVAVSLPHEQRAWVMAGEGPALRDHLRKGLVRLGADPDLRRTLGALNQRHVEQNFRFETWLEAVLALIRERCSHGQARLSKPR